MRTIKFRALKDDMSNCNFVYGSLTYSPIGEPRIQTAGDDTHHTCLKNTEGEYTGLKDRNGKEIYEGDIVAVDNLWYGQPDCIKENKNKEFFYYEVTHCGTFTCGDCGQSGGWRIADRPRDVKVAGNIWESKELLNG